MNARSNNTAANAAANTAALAAKVATIAEPTGNIDLSDPVKKAAYTSYLRRIGVARSWLKPTVYAERTARHPVTTSLTDDLLLPSMRVAIEMVCELKAIAVPSFSVMRKVRRQMVLKGSAYWMGVTFYAASADLALSSEVPLEATGPVAPSAPSALVPAKGTKPAKATKGTKPAK